MKYTLIIILAAFIGCSANYKQPGRDRGPRPDSLKTPSKYEILATPEQMIHQYIKEFSGITKEQIFDNSIKWIALNFKSAKQVIDYQDKSVGTIIAKGQIPDVDLDGRKVDVGFTLTIDAKDDKGRFNFTNILAYYHDKELPNLSDKAELHIGATKAFDVVVELLSKAIITKDDF